MLDRDPDYDDKTLEPSAATLRKDYLRGHPAGSTTSRRSTCSDSIAIGQVLRFAHRLYSLLGRNTKGVLAVEVEPNDDSWIDLCASLGVTLVWPTVFEQVQP